MNKVMKGNNTEIIKKKKKESTVPKKLFVFHSSFFPSRSDIRFHISRRLRVLGKKAKELSCYSFSQTKYDNNINYTKECLTRKAVNKKTIGTSKDKGNFTHHSMQRPPLS